MMREKGIPWLWPWLEYRLALKQRDAVLAADKLEELTELLRKEPTQASAE